MLNGAHTVLEHACGACMCRGQRGRTQELAHTPDHVGEAEAVVCVPIGREDVTDDADVSCRLHMPIPDMSVQADKLPDC